MDAGIQRPRMAKQDSEILMNSIQDFFELALKKDHNQDENPLYKARDKLDKINHELLVENKISEKERLKKENEKIQAERILQDERIKAKTNLIPNWIEYLSVR